MDNFRWGLLLVGYFFCSRNIVASMRCQKALLLTYIVMFRPLPRFVGGFGRDQPKVIIDS